MTRIRKHLWLVLSSLAFVVALGLSKQAGPSIVLDLGMVIFAALSSVLLIRARPKLGDLWGACLVAGIMSAVFLWSRLPSQLPFISDLWQHGQSTKYLLAIILFVSLWCGLQLLHRFLRMREETRVLKMLRKRILQSSDELTRESLRDALTWEKAVDNSVVGNRLKTLVDNATNLDQLAWLVTEKAGVDAARLQVDYGPLRSLVWALPALGFIGTATAMAASIGGVEGTIHNGVPAEARASMLNQVVPNLADAFGITLFALANTVVSYFLLTLACSREESLLLDTNTFVLEVIAKLGASQASGNAGDVSASLLAELWSLECEIAKLAGQVGRILDGRGYSETLSSYLYAIVAQLKVMNERRRDTRKIAGTVNPASESDGNNAVLDDISVQLLQLNQHLVMLLRTATPPLEDADDEHRG